MLEFCRIPGTRKEIMDYLNLFNIDRFNERYMRPLPDSGKLRMTLPDKLKSGNQKYLKLDDDERMETVKITYAMHCSHRK